MQSIRLRPTDLWWKRQKRPATNWLSIAKIRSDGVMHRIFQSLELVLSVNIFIAINDWYLKVLLHIYWYILCSYFLDSEKPIKDFAVFCYSINDGMSFFFYNKISRSQSLCAFPFEHENEHRTGTTSKLAFAQ